MSNKGISAIIPNYNGRLLLEQILPSLFAALQATALPYEVIVSDDFSTDQSTQFLQQHYPQVQTIRNTFNRGFAPTINAGIFKAQYDYVLLLNSDVKLQSDFFKPLLPYFDEADTFGVMGRILGWDDDVIQDAAKYPSFHGVKIKTSRNYYLEQPAAEDRLYSMYLSGANALVCRDKLLMLQGFNELFAPYYVEDVELCLRAWRLGWKCYYDHTAVCRHKTSTSIKSKDSKQNIRVVYNRNKMFLHAIHLQGITRLLWLLQLFSEACLQLLVGRFDFLQSVKLFFKDYAAVSASRKTLQSLAGKDVKLKKVEEVAAFILSDIKGKDIIIF